MKWASLAESPRGHTGLRMSRLDNKETGAVIVVMQRVHMDDLSGFLSSSSDDWEVLSLPAIAEADESIQIGIEEFYQRSAGEALHPAHESLATLRKQQQTLGPDVFSAQYQQSPVPPGGAMVKRIWLRHYDVAPEGWRGTVIQSWDTAAKDGAQNDWSVCTTWLLVDEHFYLLDLTRGRYEYPQLRDTALALAERYKPSKILIEDIHRYRARPGTESNPPLLCKTHSGGAGQDRPALRSTRQVRGRSRAISKGCGISGRA
jgi:hypothetical protein